MYPVSIHISICPYIHVTIYIYRLCIIIYIHIICTHTHVYMYKYIYIIINIYIYACVCIYVYIYTYNDVYIYIYNDIYIYTYIHMSIYPFFRSRPRRSLKWGHPRPARPWLILLAVSRVGSSGGGFVGAFNIKIWGFPARHGGTTKVAGTGNYPICKWMMTGGTPPSMEPPPGLVA